MLVLLAIPVMAAVSLAYRLVQAAAPSNMLIAHVRGRRPRFHGAACLAALALALVTLAHGVALAISSGAPGWLNLVEVVLAWDAIKIGLLAASLVARSAIPPGLRKGSRHQSSLREASQR